MTDKHPPDLQAAVDQRMAMHDITACEPTNEQMDAEIIESLKAKVEALTKERDRSEASRLAMCDSEVTVAGRMMKERDALKAALWDVVEAADALDKVISGASIHDISTRSISDAKATVSAKAAVQNAVNRTRALLGEKGKS